MCVSGQTQAPAALPREKNSRYQMMKRPGGSQSRYGGGNEENNPCLCRESNPQRPGYSNSTELYILGQF
jgi:hypothetical protein